MNVKANTNLSISVNFKISVKIIITVKNRTKNEVKNILLNCAEGLFRFFFIMLIEIKMLAKAIITAIIIDNQITFFLFPFCLIH